MRTMTTAEAAQALKVSRARVLQLIRTGALPAEKAGGTWLLDSDAVEERRSSNPQAGRPSRRTAEAQTYTLMNREHEVLTFDYDPRTGAFLDTYAIRDPQRAPLGVMSPRGKSASRQALARWWGQRAIPGNRQGIDARLSELGISRAEDIPFRNLGLSLSDQYWVRPAGSSIRWQDINYFDNSFTEMEADAWLSEVGLDSPDNTSDGMLPKAWVHEGSTACLLKGGGLLDQEPYSEAVATALHRRLLQPGEFVPYEVVTRGGTTMSSCPSFIGPEEEYVPAHYVCQIMPQAPHRDSFHHYIECCALLGVTDAEAALQKMVVCDDLLANTDRHWRNFGLVRNVEDLTYRTAPIFDSGTSLWCNLRTKDMPYSTFAFDTKPFRDDPDDQLRLVSDFSWLDRDRLAGFPEEAAGILDQAPGLAGRVDFIFAGIQSRVDHLLAIIG